MANAWRGEATIHIDGKDRTLAFTQNDIADLEDTLGGCSVVGILRKGEADSISFLRAAIAVGLRREVRLTPRQVGTLLGKEYGKTSVFVAAVMKAIVLALQGPGVAERFRQIEDDEQDEASADDDEQEADDADHPPLAGVGTGSPASAPQPE